MRNQFQAQAFTVPCKNGTRTVPALSTYPTVPSGWPNRAVRRAIQKGRESSLPAPWKAALIRDWALRGAIRALA